MEHQRRKTQEFLTPRATIIGRSIYFSRTPIFTTGKYFSILENPILESALGFLRGFFYSFGVAN